MARLLTVSLASALLLALPARAEDAADVPPSCHNGMIGGVNCFVTKQDVKQAKEAFKRGVKILDPQHLGAQNVDEQDPQTLAEALAEFEKASRLAPQNVQYLTAREAVRSKLVFGHIQSGNELMLKQARLRAATEFRAALDLDPDNEFAKERYADATRENEPSPAASAFAGELAEKLAESTELHLEPAGDRATFHYTGDARGLFEQLGAAYKINVQFDDSVKRQEVRFNLDDVDFFTALNLACRVSKTMWTALDTHQVLIAEDSTQNHKQFDRFSLRTFYLPPQDTPQEATGLMNLVRNMFDLKFISLGQTADTIEVRGPAGTLDAAAQMLQQLSHPRPEVMLDLRVYQISHQLTRNIGLHAPNTFNLYNIPAIALAGLGGQSISQLINQLISSGGINQAGSSSLSGLLAQLTGGSNSIFSQPLATFGGGLTFMGLSLDQLAAQLSVNESWVRTLDDLSLRAEQGTDATFHLGERYPVLNASFAPIYNSPQISQVLGNQSYQAPFPSVSYEDLGLQFKAKPTIQGDGSVSLQIELQVRSLTGQSNNGVPIISNREYKGDITLKDGEPAFVAGEISRSDTLSMSGIPGLGLIPGLGSAMVNNTKEEDDDELMIAITPHVTSNFVRSTPAIWITQR